MKIIFSKIKSKFFLGITLFRVRIFRSLKNSKVLNSSVSKPPKQGMPSTNFVKVKNKEFYRLWSATARFRGNFQQKIIRTIKYFVFYLNIQRKNFSKIHNSILLTLVLALIVPIYSIFAQTMQSGGYKIISDTVNTAGTDSSSTNYKLNETLGEVGTGNSNSTNYNLHAGFWQMQESYIAITSPSDLALTSIGGITGEASEGTLTWQVTTDNLAGYSMTIESVTSPALTSPDDSFDDYVPAGANPDYDFSIASTVSEFGFSPEGGDTIVRFKDNGSACNVDVGETVGKCWDGLSTSPQTVFYRTTSNHTAGSTNVVRFRAESGADHIQTSGSYAAPITVTAITL